MMNLLYIASPSSIHDIKWMSFFADQKSAYKVYLVGESQNINEFNKMKNKMEKLNIHLLPSIATFSITSPLRTLSSISKLRSYISQYSIDLVHVLFATPHALWINYVKVPYIITTRGSDVLIVLPSLMRGAGLRGVYNKVLLKNFKKAFVKAKVNTCTSISQSDKLKEFFQINNIEIIRTGVDVTRIASSKDQSLLDPELIGKKYIFSPRFMSPLYNIEIQIEAMAYLPEEIRQNYIFVFIRGKSLDKEYYEKMKVKLDEAQTRLNTSYLILDYLDQEVLWVYYNFASLTMMTPVSDGTPNSALEAMSAKCPLIMPALPYDKYIFENTCLVLNHNDPKELAGLIEKALFSYPPGLLDTAFERASERGNRMNEMAKLEKLYH